MINPLRGIRVAFPTALQFYCLPAQICFCFLLFLTIFNHRKGYFSIIIRYLKWCKVDYKSISPVRLSALSTFTALKIAKCILADSEACLNCQAFSTRALHSVDRKKNHRVESKPFEPLVRDSWRPGDYAIYTPPLQIKYTPQAILYLSPQAIKTGN